MSIPPTPLIACSNELKNRNKLPLSKIASFFYIYIYVTDNIVALEKDNGFTIKF